MPDTGNRELGGDGWGTIMRPDIRGRGELKFWSVRSWFRVGRCCVPRLKTQGGKSELAVSSLFSGTSLKFKWDLGFCCHLKQISHFFLGFVWLRLILCV